MRYVSSRVDAFTTGVLLWHAKMAAVTRVASRPTAESVTAAMHSPSLHLPISGAISTHSARLSIA